MSRVAVWLCGAALAWPQTASRPAFEVASVKASVANSRSNTNIPLGPGDAFAATGGSFSATGFPLEAYIVFAYKLSGNQVQALRAQLPGWTATDPYDILAKAAGNPTKDEYRMMLRALLAERFQLAMHEETREVPVAAMVMAKEGKLGPQLRAHTDNEPCPLDAAPGAMTPDGRFPLLCGGLVQLQPSVRGRLRFGGRNITIEFIGRALSAGTASGRPLVDETGLSGKFDFSVEFTQEGRSPVNEADAAAPTLEDALRDQLGFKLVSRKAPQTVLVVNHVARPTEN
ncbi:MAG TPA: TIGR03435 family protein [Candidatus Limnocylindrales bacterium]|nr:TIGR03435 family protein [Candidatus Limnocylindrales bacterium]